MKNISFSGKILYKIFTLVIITLLSVAADTSAKVINTEYMQSKRLSVNIKNQPLTTLFQYIEKNSEFVFLYSSSDINPHFRVTVEMKDATVDHILNQALTGSDLEYSINNRQITISKSTKKTAPPRNISGIVSDTYKNPMVGALVTIKGSLSGAITDVDGHFSLQATDGDILTVSFMGYKPQEIPVKQHTIFNIILEEDALSVDEVVVVGFGSQKKVNLTGSVATVSSDVFRERPVQNAGQALQGVAAGLNVTSSIGGIGSKPKLNIRGETTIGLGSNGDPLILIDGMEGDINTINPQDIESISVLKDAAASSIYGSRAPFGVILVTTKSGKSGRVTINYNNSFRFSSASNIPNTVNSYRFANYINEGLGNANKVGKFGADVLDRLKRYNEGSLTTKNIPDPTNPDVWANPKYNANDNVNWFDALFGGTSFSQEHTVSITGGTDKLQVYASLNYLNENGLLQIAEDRYKRYATNLKITGNINSYLKFNYNIKFNREDFKRPTFFDDVTVYRALTWTFPNIPLKDDNGFYYENEYRMPSALSIADGGTYKNNTNNMYQQFKLTATPLENWNINAEVNYRLNIYNQHQDTQLFYNHGVDGVHLYDPMMPLENSDVTELNRQFNYLNPNVYSDYFLSLADAHNIKLMVGFQAERQWSQMLSAQRTGIIVPYMDQIDVTNGLSPDGSSTPPLVAGNTQNWATAGFFGRLNYDYKGRYLLEANLRYDGTSRYRADKRWKWFPSFSVGWNISQEDFWKNLTDICNLLKVRASYGELGNQNTTELYPTYQTLTIKPGGGYYLINNLPQTIVNSPTILNALMTWERIKTFDIGLDFGFLNNRLTGSFDYYKRTTADMIGPGEELPNIYGKDVPNANNTELKSYGWDLSVKWQDRLANGIGYSASFLLYDSRSEITKYPNQGMTLDLLNKGGSALGGVPCRYYEGEKTGEIWGYQTIGIAQTQEEMDRHLASLPNGGQSALGNSFGAGDIMYADLNNDGKISSGSGSAKDPGDMKVIGNQTPRYNFGIDLGVDYKGFDLRLFLQGTMKRDFASSDVLFFGAQAGESALITESHMDYFREAANHPFGQNLNAYYPRPIVDSENAKNARVQTRYLLNAAYMRLKNMQIGYTLPERITNQYGINRLRFFLSGENLLTFTKLPNMYDPETVSLGTTRADNQPGIKSSGDILGAAYPVLRTFSFGLSVTF